MGRTTAAVRITGRLLVVVVLAATTLITVAGSALADTTYAAEENTFVAKINAERAQRNLGRLTVNLQLTGVARGWSDEMARAGRIWHNPRLAVQAEGDWTRLGENVGYSTNGGSTPSQLVDRLHTAFMNSPGHKANVLGDFNQVGVGIRITGATMWVTVNFSKAPTIVSNGSVSEATRVAGRVFATAGRDGRKASYVVVTPSDKPAHAMGGAALAGANGPLLYTHPATRWNSDPVLHPITRAEIDRVLGGKGLVYLLGNKTSVSERAARELSADGYTVKRLVGRSTEGTLVRIADETIKRRGNTGRVVIGSTTDWGTSVAAAMYSARSGTPFLVTSKSSLHPEVKAFLDRNRPAKRWVVGPKTSITPAVASAAKAARVGGKSRARVSVNVAKVLWKRTSATNGDRWASTPGFSNRGWAYTLAYAPWSAANDGPALLMGTTSVPPPVATYLANLRYGDAVRGQVQAASLISAPVVNRFQTLVAAP
jgi:uncharacterized protein YkwD